MLVSGSGRSLKQTERGRLHQLGQFQEQRNRMQSRFYAQLAMMNNIIESGCSQSVDVTTEAEKLQKLFQEFMALHSKCQMLIADEEREKEEGIAERVDVDFYNHRRRYNSWLSKQQKGSPPPPSSKSSRKSRKTRSSTISSRCISEKLAKERARLAELQVENEFRLEMESKKKEMESKKKELDEMKSKVEIAKVKAKVKVYEEELNDVKEGDIDAEVALADLPKYESGAYARAFVENLPNSQLEEVPVSQIYRPPIHEILNKHTIPRPADPTQPPQQLSTLAREFTSKVNAYQIQPDELLPELSSLQRSNKIEVLPKRYSINQQTQEVLNPSPVEISDIFKEMQAPSVKLDVFSGDPTDFPYFITTFVQAVEEKVRDEKGKLARLIQYTRGAANELAKSCIYLPDNICYIRAKSLLTQKYGSPFTIAAEYRKQLTNWPRLKANDVASFTKFENFLIKFQSSMSAVGRTSECNPELLQLLQSKLPPYLQDRWNRTAYKIRKESNAEVSLDNFIKGISEETAIISDPLFSRDAITELYKGRDNPIIKQKSKIFNIRTNEVCVCCKKTSHDLEKCCFYLHMNVNERKKFVFKHRLCFRCLEPTTDSHIGKSCKEPRTCTECNQPHPTSLHTTEGKVHVNYVKQQTKAIGLCIVPVRLCHQDNPGKVVSTFALLDNGSQGTFIHESLMEQLQLHGTKTCLEIQTITGKLYEASAYVKGLRVSACNETGGYVALPKTFSRNSFPVNPNEVPTPSKLKKWKYLQPIFKHLSKTTSNISIGLLIGSNCPQALEPLSTIQSENGGPYAIKSRLGWCVAGPMESIKNEERTVNCNKIVIKPADKDYSNHYFTFKETIKDVSVKQSMLTMYNLDFHESSNRQALSVEDERFLKLMKNGIQHDGKYYFPLPIRSPDKKVPNNRLQVIQRANWLKRKLTKNDQMLQDYKVFMNMLLEKGFAKVAEKPPTPNKTWYIPHHAVYHPQKPGKIRVVFDCSMECNNYCLNNEVLQGPDLTNQLVGVLLRFRQDEVAVMADIESMFYQVKVPEEYHDYLRFVWWPNGDLSQDLLDHQMCVHIFGAASSPGCAKYALRKTAKDYKTQFGETAAAILKRNFYVDDLLKSFPNNKVAIDTIPKVVGMANAGGFRLTKFHSNDRTFLSTIPENERSRQLKDLDIISNPLPTERALGMNWCPESDKFRFQIQLKNKPITRRGVLSNISSIYDPLGIAAPYLLEGKKILQQICVEKGWDEPLSESQQNSWERWKNEIIKLKDFQVDRCFYPRKFGRVTSITLHHFSDASSDSYGQVSYIRMVNEQNKISCRLVIAKSRVAPVKRPTIPRLELTAAVLSVKVALLLKEELDVPLSNEYFWTDSQVVLAYISNETKRFHIFVANRVKFIRENSELRQWRYVPSKETPADDASRGLHLSTTARNQRWTQGPDFLYRLERHWPKQPSTMIICQEDKELRKIKCNVVVTRSADIMTNLEEVTSKWLRLKRIVATMLIWVRKRKINVEDLQNAENIIFRLIQKRAFPEEMVLLQRQNLNQKNKYVKRGSPLAKLAPFIDEKGVLRVGGRIQCADLPYKVKHPIILPRRCATTNLIVSHIHQSVHHLGRISTLNELRSQGFWVINGNSLVRFIISKCVKCKILRGQTSVQRMAELPKDRLEPSAPFTYCGLDMFGPFIIRERRSDLKRYSIIFTCLNCRAVHFECVSTMDTDSFILCLRRFIGRRGPIRTIRCDNGTNFIGAKNELQRAVHEMDTSKISNFLLNLGTDFISWKQNPPYSSNFGGVWERLIRSARAILDGLMMSHGHSMNEEAFRTLLVEIEAIMNSRPLTTDGQSDPDCLPLSPINLLTMKSRVVPPPPGVFQKGDMYCRRRWRRVQHLANEFWSRWRKEYLQQLQGRSKWQTKQRNLKIGDIVLEKDDNECRNKWKMGIVTKTHISYDGNARSVTIRRNNATYDRPVSKLVVLIESENEFPDEGAIDTQFDKTH